MKCSGKYKWTWYKRTHERMPINNEIAMIQSFFVFFPCCRLDSLRNTCNTNHSTAHSITRDRENAFVTAEASITIFSNSLLPQQSPLAVARDKHMTRIAFEAEFSIVVLLINPTITVDIVKIVSISLPPQRQYSTNLYLEAMGLMAHSFLRNIFWC